MERKIWLIFLLIFIRFNFGCKNEKIINKNEKIEEIYINLPYEIFNNFQNCLRDEIVNFNVEKKELISLNYRLTWNQYRIYLRKTWEELKNKIIPIFLKENTHYSIKNSKAYKEIIIDYSYLVKEVKIKITAFYLFFPAEENLGKKEKPILALVIDDLIKKNYWTDRLFSFSYTLNLAIIPTSHAKELIKEAEKKDWYIIMHTPMESISYPNDAKYLISYPILAGMSEEEIKNILEKNLNFFGDYPIEGINNHMGSKVTSDPETMKNLFEVLREKKLFFLDSKTTSKSVGRKVAREMGVPFLENNLFLDHENNKEKIRMRFIQAKKIAEIKGRAIVICHLRPYTIEVMEELEKNNFFNDIELVKLKELLKY